MTIRTYYDKGLLFYISNQDQTEYIAVQLSRNRLSIVYNDGERTPLEAMGTTGGRKILMSEDLIGDGLWHTVSTQIKSMTCWFCSLDKVSKHVSSKML